jgi:hypothetical protein
LRDFRNALRQPLQVQGSLLARYLRENRDTVFGRAFHFSRILESAGVERNPDSDRWAAALAAEYQKRVPVTSYDDIEPLVQRIRSGDAAVLTRAPVRRLVPSSGSSAAAKLVPWTREVQREFGRAVDVWVADLFLGQPSLVDGPAYWSISPALPVDGSGAVPVGFDDDSAYLGGVRQLLARGILAVPDAVGRVDDFDAFRYLTLLFLVRARDLRLVSVWHPTFFTRLLDALPQWLDRITRDISEGTLSPPGRIGADLRQAVERSLAPDHRRSRELRGLRTADPGDIWPYLGLVSCWADGPSRPYADQLARRLRRARLQPKGLMATEGVVTIPFQNQYPLAIRSHFFEFLDRHDRPRLAHELETGEEYTIVLTTGGGLYRYRLGDRVEVAGWMGRTPSLRFIGKDDRISDRFGEKISDGFVARVIETVLDGRVARFAMLAPEGPPDGVAYTLFLESEWSPPSTLTAALERELRRNPHYAWCVDIGQLRPARTVIVGPNADRAYVDACVAKGQRLGDVKPVSLHRDSGWEAVLTSVVQPFGLHLEDS